MSDLAEDLNALDSKLRKQQLKTPTFQRTFAWNSGAAEHVRLDDTSTRVVYWEGEGRIFGADGAELYDHEYVYVFPKLRDREDYSYPRIEVDHWHGWGQMDHEGNYDVVGLSL